MLQKYNLLHRYLLNTKPFVEVNRPVYLRAPNFVIAMHADGQAPNGAKPSADTALTTKLYVFLWLSTIMVIFFFFFFFLGGGNVRRNLAIYICIYSYSCHSFHCFLKCNENIVTLTKLWSLTAPEAVKITSSASEENIVKWRQFRFSVRLATTLQWRHNGCDSLSNHQPHGCLLNRLFRRRSKETSKLRVTGLCEGNSPGTGEFPAQMASYAENVSIWWRHHEMTQALYFYRLCGKSPTESPKCGKNTPIRFQ